MAEALSKATMNAHHDSPAQYVTLARRAGSCLIASLMILATGCVSLKSVNTAQPIVAAVSRANGKAAATQPPAKAEGLRTVLRRASAAAGLKVQAALQQAGLYKLPGVRELVASARSGQPVVLNNHTVRALAKTLLTCLHQELFSATIGTNGSVRAAAGPPGAKPQPDDVFGLMEAYFTAYVNGQYTLRDGTVLGKPTVNLSLANGSLQGSIPNDAVDAIVTIFTEAINDSIYQTPLFYALQTNTVYTNQWVRTSDVYSDVRSPYQDTYVQIYRPSVTVQKDYFLNGKVPTASKFLTCYPVVSKGSGGKKTGRGGLTGDEVQFIRAVSSLSSKQSQALGSLAFQSFGGTSAGQFVYVHFSVGNNQILSSIVSTLLASSSYHASERALTDVFLDYDGTDPVVQELLTHYHALLATVSKQ
jgi:hypothetical protein